MAVPVAVPVAVPMAVPVAPAGMGLAAVATAGMGLAAVAAAGMGLAAVATAGTGAAQAGPGVAEVRVGVCFERSPTLLARPLPNAECGPCGVAPSCV